MPSLSSSQSNRVKFIIALLIFAAAGASLVAWRSSAAKKEEKKADEKIFEFVSSDLARVEARELGNAIPVSGTLKPLTQATVKSKVAAEVARVHVQEGEHVTAGQILVTLDTADLRARLDTQHASLAEMKARLELAKKNEANSRQLLSKGFISQNAFDAIASNVEITAANLKSAEAQAAIAQRALADATIRAPFAGIVAKRLINVGEKLNPDSPVMHIVDLSRMELEAMVPVAEIPGVKIGQEIAFKVDGFNERAFKGQVERINPAAETGSRSIAVFVTLPNADAALKGGMFASGRLAALSRGAVSAIPLVALREEGGQNYVLIVKNDKIDRKPVTAGTRNVDMGLVEIRERLEPGTTVVAVKMEGLKPGAKAIIKNAASPDSPKTANGKG